VEFHENPIGNNSEGYLRFSLAPDEKVLEEAIFRIRVGIEILRE